MSDFSGVDFAIGSVMGWREWNLTPEGALEPLHKSGTWKPGENLAICDRWVGKDEVGERGDLSHKEYEDLKNEWKRSHEMTDCEHGFYAYFDPAVPGKTYGGPRVSGVIEGYGELLIGEKGFRAMKAKILALSVAPYQGMWRLEQFFVDRLRANYPGVPIFESEIAMRAEFPCREWEGEQVAVA